MEPDLGWLFVLLGLGGAVLTSTSWVPQVIKGYRTRRLKDLSVATLAIFGTGTLCWLAYGVYRHDWLIIGANAFIAVCIAVLLVMKALFRPRRTGR